MSTKDASVVFGVPVEIDIPGIKGATLSPLTFDELAIIKERITKERLASIPTVDSVLRSLSEHASKEVVAEAMRVVYDLSQEARIVDFESVMAYAMTPFGFNELLKYCLKGKGITPSHSATVVMQFIQQGIDDLNSPFSRWMEASGFKKPVDPSKSETSS